MRKNNKNYCIYSKNRQRMCGFIFFSFIMYYVLFLPCNHKNVNEIKINNTNKNNRLTCGVHVNDQNAQNGGKRYDKQGYW